MAYIPTETNYSRARAYLDMAESRARIPTWLDASTPLRAAVRDYWRGEVAAGSVALARLARICAARGYDYRQVVEVLR